MLKTCRCQRLIHCQEVGFAVCIINLTELALSHHSTKACILLYCKVIGRYMLHIHCQNPLQRIVQFGIAESRNTKNHIDRYIIVARRLEHFHRIFSLLGRVATTHKLQTPIIERLHSHRDAINRCFTQFGHILGCYVIGINLDSHLLQLGAIKERARLTDKPLYFAWRKQRWRTSAEVDCANRLVADKISLSLQFVVHNLNNIRNIPQLHTAIKVAISAQTLAERYMKI